MQDTVRLCCPAKLNLHLQVKEKRSDNYHNLESLFQTISLYDELSVKRIIEPECRLFVEGMNLASKNTISDAYEAFRAYTGIISGIEVFVKKRIPAGAGLGGGSSDAAGIIQALDEVYGTKLRLDERLEIAASVGSDVPFFIQGGAAIVSGRGEIIRNIRQRNDLFFVLIFPELHSSTKEAYQKVDTEIEEGRSPKGPPLNELEAMYYENPKNWFFINSFSSVLMSQQSLIMQAFTDLKEENSLYVQMSGAGSSVYGVFLDEMLAQNAFKNLSNKWKRSYALTSSTVDCC